MLHERWILLLLMPLISGDIRLCMNWLATRRMLRNTMPCERCNNLCRLNHYQQGIDDWRSACNGCKFTASVRSGSFFDKSHIPLSRIILLIYYWAKMTQQTTVREELEIGSDHTTVDWYNFCRDVCEHYLVNNPVQIGGIDLDDNGNIVPKVVEIDESKFFHRKYHRGQWREGHWVFGGIERGSNKCFFFEVDRRDEATLRPLIEQWILPGTKIISDGWRAYNNINAYQDGIYQHDVIIHEQNFVDPHNRNIHTQNVESMWSRAKRMFRKMYGTSRALFESYLVEFMWRESFGRDNPFSAILCNIADQYRL